jgi:hypothetical protein
MPTREQVAEVIGGIVNQVETAEAPTRIPKAEWQWYGHAAHFICGRWCRFHLATTVGGYLVSTVGEYVPPEGVMKITAEIKGQPLTQRGDALEAEFLEKFGFEKLGAWGTYETLVFPWSGKTCEAEGCKCGLPMPDSFMEVDGIRYDSASDARAGHYKYCERAAIGKLGDVPGHLAALRGILRDAGAGE